jgi:hypothetical protein
MCDAMWAYKGKQYIATIEEGFYNPFQIATELTNRMNLAVTNVIVDYIQNTLNDAALLEQFNKTGYDQFVVAYNEVGQKLWFGNKSSEFIVSNNSQVYVTNTLAEATCTRQHYPDFSNWGLPAYLGFSRQVATTTTSSGGVYPRFYYGDVYAGDNGYWLLPDLPSAQVYFVEPVYKVNLMGPSYMYMEIEGQNCIDETQPYNFSKFTFTTNQTNGIVNSSFAKIAVPTTPLSQWFDRDAVPYKLYNPPAERIRRLKIKLRYQNGRSVNFGLFNYSFMLQFSLMVPQILRSSRTIVYPPPMNY